MTRLRLDIDMLRRAAREAGSDVLHEHVAQSWFRAAESGAAVLRRTGDLLAGRHAPENVNTLADAVRAYRGALDEMRRAGLMRPLPTADRKSVGSGKSVSVRVDRGGRRIIKKKNTMNK